ncbi:endonuclease III [Butyricimonas hominis]|uniref:Endonuclease III n=1 Tax=Butyricimonas hominis TaxID=2763032 RepID=A0ABR7CXU6_9BACT|nr:endonuclease III [Butyricimonas hominis]MBC5620488.1 endonuclease III [Butyricimonas hominis]
MELKERYDRVLAWFREEMPVADTELRYNNPFQLLVAVILSAQCTDKRVNMVTPALFERFPTAEAMAGATIEEIFELIRSISYPNNKSKHLSAMAKKLMNEFNGEVPSDFELLQTLPGVGRKTANVMEAVAFGRPAMPVDTHVFRVADRIGLVTGARTPLETEKQLVANIPAEWLSRAHHWLILHGRYVCTARSPKCGECGIKNWCRKQNGE